MFIGDDRVRMLYQSFLLHLNPHDDDNTSMLSAAVASVDANIRNNLEYVDNKLRLRVNYIYANEVSTTLIDTFSKWQKDEDSPSAIVASCTYSGFYNGNLTLDTLNKFHINLTRLVQPIDGLIAKKSKVLWKLQDYINEDVDHLADDWKNVQNSDIDKFNQAIYDILGYSDVHIWSSSKRIASGLLSEATDGWRLSPLTLQHDTQILLNMYCNDYMNYNDGSCCSSAEPYTILQIVTYAVFGVW